MSVFDVPVYALFFNCYKKTQMPYRKNHPQLPQGLIRNSNKKEKCASATKACLMNSSCRSKFRSQFIRKLWNIIPLLHILFKKKKKRKDKTLTAILINTSSLILWYHDFLGTFFYYQNSMIEGVFKKSLFLWSTIPENSYLRVWRFMMEERTVLLRNREA